jgi:hypothetical protein
MELLTGAIVSIVVQIVKKYFGTSEYMTLGVLAVLTIVAAGAYTYLTAAGYWQTALQILITAGAFYTIVIARFNAVN